MSRKSTPISDADWASMQARHGLADSDRKFFCERGTGYTKAQIDAVMLRAKGILLSHLGTLVAAGEGI